MLDRTKTAQMINPFIGTLLILISLITFPSFVSAFDLKDQTAEDYRTKGYEEQQKGNLYEALKNYKKAITLGIENPVVYNDIGILNEQLNRLKHAGQYYQQAIKEDSGYLPAYTNLAYLYLRLGQPEDALKYFIRRYELSVPGDPWAEKVKEEIIKINPDFQDWFLSLEAAQFENEIVRRAQEEFMRRVQAAHEHYWRGEEYHKKGLYEAAIDEFDVALVLLPDNIKFIEARKKSVVESSKINIKRHTNLAIRSLEIGDSDSAKDEIRKLLTTIPNVSE